MEILDCLYQTVIMNKGDIRVVRGCRRTKGMQGGARAAARQLSHRRVLVCRPFKIDDIAAAHATVEMQKDAPTTKNKQDSTRAKAVQFKHRH